MEVLKWLFGEYPQYIVAVLIIYGLGISVLRTYVFIRTQYWEAKKSYMSALFNYCEEVSDIVGRLRSSDTYPADKAAAFWAYYFGKLILVEDMNLEKKMVAFGRLLESVNATNYAEKKKTLHNAALEVSGACRDLIKASWSLSIVPWDDLREKTRR
jgi:hypothetical protein